MWHARDRVFKRHIEQLKHTWAYDLQAVARAIQAALKEAAREAVPRWAATALTKLPQARLSEALRILATAARERAASAEGADTYRMLERELSRCRSALEQVVAIVADGYKPKSVARVSEEITGLVRRLFMEGDPPTVREPEAWTEIFRTATIRLTGPRREISDRLEGIEAAKQLGRLAQRVAELTQRSEGNRRPAIVAVWPENARCGLSLYRPIDLDRLAESNYLELKFSRDLHWTALLTAVDLIENHSRLLWRLLESQLTAAPLEARYQLMHRLAGEHALTGRHAHQLRALAAPAAIFLTIEPDHDSTRPAGSDESDEDAGASAREGDPIAMYCVRLSSIDRSATVIERRNPVTRERFQRVLAEIDQIGLSSAADPQQAGRLVQRLARSGSLLGDDILHGIGDELAKITSEDNRPVHLVLQMPRELMRYPWELLRDESGWLVDRFAIGRQLIADLETVGRWSSSRRQGPLRLLVVAPKVSGDGGEVTGVGVLEGDHVATCFEQLQERLPGLVDPSDFRGYVDKEVTVDQFRELIREQQYDVVHFAGHGRYDARHPERSCWRFSDGDLYAFELRHTLANARVTPWLVYGSACEGARELGERQRGYHDGVYGMASAALGQGVAAYIGPLWKIAETDAKNLAAVFYQALLLRRTSIGEALALARRLVREGLIGDDDGFSPVVDGNGVDHGPAGPVRSVGWAGIALYGDPTPTILQRLSPSDADGPLEVRNPEPAAT
jgi:CHAT domain-containing protein